MKKTGTTKTSRLLFLFVLAGVAAIALSGRKAKGPYGPFSAA